MISRSVAQVARLAAAPRGVVQNSVRNSSAYKPPAHWYNPTLDELPVPTGSWKAHYDAQQTKYNIQLGVGVTFFIGTMIYLKSNGPYLNYDIPKLD